MDDILFGGGVEYTEITPSFTITPGGIITEILFLNSDIISSNSNVISPGGNLVDMLYGGDLLNTDLTPVYFITPGGVIDDTVYYDSNAVFSKTDVFLPPNGSGGLISGFSMDGFNFHIIDQVDYEAATDNGDCVTINVF